MPWITAPSIWPWWSTGLITLPTSWAVVKRSSVTWPVSGSTDTSATWAVKDEVGERSGSNTWPLATTGRPNWVSSSAQGLLSEVSRRITFAPRIDVCSSGQPKRSAATLSISLDASLAA